MGAPQLQQLFPTVDAAFPVNDRIALLLLALSTPHLLYLFTWTRAAAFTRLAKAAGVPAFDLFYQLSVLLKFVQLAALIAFGMTVRAWVGGRVGGQRVQYLVVACQWRVYSAGRRICARRVDSTRSVGRARQMALTDPTASFPTDRPNEKKTTGDDLLQGRERAPRAVGPGRAPLRGRAGAQHERVQGAR